MDKDLPDLTSHKFLHHSILKAHLQKLFPNSHQPPTISNLHVSLANRAHLTLYIEKAKKTHFPAGTGWEGKIGVYAFIIQLLTLVLSRIATIEKIAGRIT